MPTSWLDKSSFDAGLWTGNQEVVPRALRCVPNPTLQRDASDCEA